MRTDRREGTEMKGVNEKERGGIKKNSWKEEERKGIKDRWKVGKKGLKGWRRERE